MGQVNLGLLATMSETGPSRVLTRLFLSLHMSLLLMYWSLKTSSTKSRATSAAWTFCTWTGLQARSWNNEATPCSTLTISADGQNNYIVIDDFTQVFMPCGLTFVIIMANFVFLIVRIITFIDSYSLQSSMIDLI